MQTHAVKQWIMIFVGKTLNLTHGNQEAEGRN